MPVAYIAMGSNLGIREKNLVGALEKMAEAGLKVLAVSTFMETEPYGVLDQPSFINAVVKVETELSAQKLLGLLLGIEQDMGRVRKRHWGERNIDLDLLLYDDLVIKEEKLVLPHPDMQNRIFVLAPLAEIAGAVMHPVFHITINEMLANLTNGDEDK